MKTLKIFDQNHSQLDEINNYNGNLTYGWTLNDIDTAEVSIGLESPKCTAANMAFRNHIEIWDDALAACIWGGIIAGQSFDNPALKINCLDYMALLKWRRLRAKSYTSIDYGSLLTQLLADTNTIGATGITAGSMATGALKTQRTVAETDFLLDKIVEYCLDVNYDFDVDVSRKFNFYLRKGSAKPQYTLEYGGIADNITEKPTLATDILSMINSYYGSNGSLSATASDATSMALYGLMEGTFSANAGVTDQATLNNETAGALQRTAYPLNTFTIKAIDSALCPFSDIKVGDTITISLVPYFGFMQPMRILRMVHDENTGVRQFEFGNIVFKPQKGNKKIYIG